MLPFLIIGPVLLVAIYIIAALIILGSIAFIAMKEKLISHIIIWSLLCVFLPIIGSVIYLSYYFSKKPKVEKLA